MVDHERIESRNGLPTLEHAEEIGLGSRTYSLISIDQQSEYLDRRNRT